MEDNEVDVYEKIAGTSEIKRTSLKAIVAAAKEILNSPSVAKIPTIIMIKDLFTSKEDIIDQEKEEE